MLLITGGSTKCVDLYNNAAEAGFEKNTKFTRAFFEVGGSHILDIMVFSNIAT